MKRNSTLAGRFALTAVAAATMVLSHTGAHALGLGRLQVQSALGESLRAEIDVTSMTPEEAANFRVRIAAPEAYRTAGVDYNPVLPGSDVSLQRRADGKPYLRLTSNRGVQEPFVDVILDLNWSTGRLVREYTLLFDPPVTARSSNTTSTVANATMPATTVATTLPVATPMVAAAPVPPIDGSASAAPAVERRSRVRPSPTDTAPASAPPAAVARASTPRQMPGNRLATSNAGAGKSEYRVRPGDSLSRIASRTQPPGVSLDQMLVSLFRGNPDAFIGSNMNRLRSGAVLAVPDATAAGAISASDAHQVIQAQSADFGAYRQRLAGVVPSARTEGSDRKQSGKVQATVTDSQQSAAPAPDKLTLSKGGADDQRISHDREKKAADVRVAELSKNVDELKKLSSAASQPVAAAPVTPRPTASAPAAVAPPVVVAAAPPAPAPTPAVTAAPAPVAAPPAAASAVVAPAPVVAAASAPAVVAPATPRAPVVATTAPPAASTPSAAVAPASAPASAPEPTTSSEPGMFGSMLDDNPIALGIGALLVLALGGFAAYRFSKRGKRDTGETSFLESRLQPDSFFGASGGQHIDTRDAGGASSSMSYSLSQLDAIGDVDPVAEADVYLAYGRDLQAEEILKEAMRSNPERLAIRTKLLEVYAKRRDTKGFELLATQLYALTHGVGEDWNKAQELGRQIDFENPLYRPGGAPQMASGESGQPIEPLGASTMPQSVLPTASQFGARATDHGDLSLDLDLGDPDAGTPTAPAPLDLSRAFGAPSRQPAAPAGSLPEDEDAMLLDFSMPDLGVPNAPSAPAFASPAPASRETPLPFDLSKISFDLDDAHHPAAENETTAPTPPHSSELGGLDLTSASDAGDGAMDDDEPLTRKLELAEEFRQIGDTDGARDLLQEVIAKASGAVKTRAQGMLADLG